MELSELFINMSTMAGKLTVLIIIMMVLAHVLWPPLGKGGKSREPQWVKQVGGALIILDCLTICVVIIGGLFTWLFSSFA